MRRITIWLTATLAAVAMTFYYQVSLSGDGKSGDHAAPSGQIQPRATTPTAPSNESPSGAGADSRVEPPANSDHTDKPGENK